MECPVCHKVSPPDWTDYTTYVRGDFKDALPAASEDDQYAWVGVEWMRCAHEPCQQLIVRVAESSATFHGHVPIQHTETWFARPRFAEASREIDATVGEPFRRDYLEAAAILDISPRMSAVLSRKILGDLLERYAQIVNKSLAKQIDTFIADPAHPRRLREGLHHFREVGDFAAHTQTDKQTNEIIDVERDEAEWTLDRVDELFEYFIIDPQRHAERMAAMDKKIADADRKAIPPLPPDPGVSSS